MCKNNAEWDRPQMIIWRMRIACWIPKATNTHRLCNTHCFSTVTTVTWTRFNVTLYIQCLSCWSLFAYSASCHLKVDFLCNFSLIIPANAVSQKYYELKVFSKQRPVQYITYREHWEVSATCRLVLGWLHWPIVCRA